MSAPNVGPTITSSTICAFAGRVPDFKTLAKSVASCKVKLPEIDERPPVIFPSTIGAEYT